MAPFRGNAGPSITLPPCTGLNDLMAGSTVTSQARFYSPADGCPIDKLDLTIESTTVPSYATGTQPNEVHLDVDGGCSGRVLLEFVPVGGNPSYYDNRNGMDGSYVSWLLGRSFSSYGVDGGMCTAPSSCSDLFVAKNDRL